MNRRQFLKWLGTTPLLLGQRWWQHWAGKSGLFDEGASNILIILFDTLSARHMSLYGYPRQTTPNVARFAERATVFHNHHAAGNFTTPGTASLLTGSYPWSHRAFHLGAATAKPWDERHLFATMTGRQRIAYTHNPLANSLILQFRPAIDTYIEPDRYTLLDVQWMARLFPNDEYIAGSSEKTMMGALQGVGSSIFYNVVNVNRSRTREAELDEQFATLFPRGIPKVTNHSAFLLEDAIDGIAEQVSQSGRPFLGYFHLYPPHAGYNTRREFVDLFDDGWSPAAKPQHFFKQGEPDERLREPRRLYDEYIAYADAEFGRLYDMLDQSGVLENSWLIFTSDHGELFERGIHGHITETLFEPVIHVPLLIARPGQRERQDVYSLTSCVDVLPTLLHLSDHPVPDWCEGRLLPLFGGAADPDRPIFAVEAKNNRRFGPLMTATIAMFQGQYKLIHYRGYEGFSNEYEFFDLKADPEERENRYNPGEPTVAAMVQALTERLRRVDQAQAA